VVVRVDGVAAVIAKLLRTKAAAKVAARKVGKVRMMAPDEGKRLVLPPV
jgi:hypothetical protein